MSSIRDIRIYPAEKVTGPSPAVSVIIPVYNRYVMLCEAAGSILCQTFSDYELIVVDDGSTDRSARIGEEGLDAVIDAAPEWLATAFDVKPAAPKAFRYIKLGHTGMPGAVRNSGAHAARGRYLAFLDSDDLWLPQKLELQAALMQDDPACRISHTRELWVRNGKVVSQSSQKHRRRGCLFEDSLVKCIIGPSTVMIERSLFLETGGFREDLEIGEDYELWLRITSKHPVRYIDQPLTVKRAGHDDQLTSKYGYIEHFRIEALASLLDGGFFDGENRKSAVAEFEKKCAIYLAGAKKRGKFKEVEKYRSMKKLYSREKKA